MSSIDTSLLFKKNKLSLKELFAREPKRSDASLA